jgi:hypothetical protein
MLFPVFAHRPVSLALRSQDRWLNWAQSTPMMPVWESPFDAANHLQACTACAEFEQIQELVIEDHALYSADSVILFADGGPIEAMPIPPNVWIKPFEIEQPLLIGDAGFEVVQVGNGQYQYRPAGTGWVFTGPSGISANGSAFTAHNPTAPEGTQVAIIQRDGSISQAVTDWPGGSYALSFAAAQRANIPGKMDFQVLIDSAIVGTFLPYSTAYKTYLTSVFVITEGAHTITFRGLNTAGGDNSAFIDAILALAVV